ncbi:hypothetical protein D3C83_182380 [compost metagenome]
MYWPWPVRSRERSAVTMANAAHIPAPMSAIDMPCFVGVPPGSPVIDIMPLIAWARAS